MSRYRKLLGNTGIYAIGNFGSKAIQLILLPLYTNYLTQEAYGTIDAVTQIITAMVPVLTLSIYDAVLRFSMDKTYSPLEVLSCAMRLIAVSTGIFAAVLAVLSLFMPGFHLLFILLLIFLNACRMTIGYYLRAMDHIKVYSVSGLTLTFVLAALNIYFIAYRGMGVEGYFYSLIVAYIASIVVMLPKMPSPRNYVRRRRGSPLLKAMLSYSVPLIPNALLWWAISASNRLFLVNYHSISESGLFAVAAKIPTVITIAMQMFVQAWQITAIEEYEKDDRDEFYSELYNLSQMILFMLCLGLIILLPLVWKIIGSAYSVSMYYVPLITLSVVFSSLSSFQGSIYLAVKKTKGVLWSTLFGGSATLLVNYLLIPKFAGYGACISLVIGFVAVWGYRILDLRKSINVNYCLMKTLVSTLACVLAFLLLYLDSQAVRIGGQLLLAALLMVLYHTEIKRLLRGIGSLMTVRSR
ncbi:MAG: lipopolysaccharide biosynthesis protein [Bacillota bacterium]|nr:lipopolysaccharide biosynthesis protein [Bacillota bacterium]